MTLLDGGKHDWFPKKDLLDGWLGDRYPLCSDLPSKPFLKIGAVYKLLGRSSLPRYQYDPEDWDGNSAIKKMTLGTSSNLYNELKCVTDGSDCTYPTVVTLDADLICHGLECDLDTVRVVQVAQDVFYEYVQRPCVNLAFIEPSASKAIFAGAYGQAAGMW